MLTDAHCHPFNLVSHFPQAEEERRRLGVIAAASACVFEEFAYNEELAKKVKEEGAAALLPCFGIHPQVFGSGEWGMGNGEQGTYSEEQLALLDKLAAEGRIAAIGECGFDLFNAAFKETEKEQDKVFAAQIEIAIRYNLPVVIHARRAMHKIFACTKSLSKCKVVVFHSWPGTLKEGKSLLRRGVNVYFSFGNTIMLSHKQQMRCCALFPADRLLTETDAPYQPRRGLDFSSWRDLPLIIEAACALRREAGSDVTDVKELEAQIEVNFSAVFGK